MTDQEFITEIEAQEKRLSLFWEPRNTMLEEDRRMIALTEPPKIKGFTSVTLNEPKVLYDTSVALLSGFEPNIKLPISTQTPEEQDKMSKSERFLIGALRELDNTQMNLGRDRFLRELAYFVCSGWYAVFPYIEVDGGECHFRCELYDPITVYPEWGSKGMLRLVRSYWTTREAAKSMTDELGWNVELRGDQDTVKVINYWVKQKGIVSNAVIIGGQLAKPQTEEPFKGIPILVGGVAGNPQFTSSSGASSSWVANRGESVIRANMSTYKQLNKWLGLVMQIVQDTAYPPIQDITATGEPALKPGELGSGAIIPRKVGEEIKTFLHAAVPPDVNNILSLLSGTVQRGGLPYVVYGGLPFELSGFALSQLMSAIVHKLAPYMNAYTSLIGAICTGFLRQYRQFGEPIELLVEKVERRGKGETFIESFTPDEIPETTFVVVNVPLALPTDKSQQVLLARQALNPPALLSRPTLWDEFLDIQDGNLEYSRIIDDMILELPVMKTITVIERIKLKVDSFRAKGNETSAQALEKYVAMLETQLTAPQTAQGGAQGGGVRPETSPIEAGGLSPDMLRVMAGIAPTGEAGKVKRPEGAV